MVHSSYGKRRTTRRPPGLWDGIPAGIRAAIISFGFLAVIFVGNGLAVSVFATTGFAPAMICYPVQLLAYLLNGILAGWQADLTRMKQLRGVGHGGERVQRNLPNFIAQGALAGLVLGLFAGLMYFAGNAIVAYFIPLVALVGFTAPWLLVVVDLVSGIGLGMLGGIIYDNWLSAPGRR